MFRMHVQRRDCYTMGSCGQCHTGHACVAIKSTAHIANSLWLSSGVASLRKCPLHAHRFVQCVFVWRLS